MVRDLEYQDITTEYFNLLCQLSGEEKDPSNKGLILWRFWNRYEDNDDHQVFVLEHKRRVVGTASILIENKLLHYGSRVGHIEDVVVDKDARLSGAGRELVKACIRFGRYKECYKVILDCSKENVPFYEGCGFTFSENCMRIDLGEK